jgi:hypothetical protein
MSEATERTEVLGEAGETCRECAAPLAVDQRYCLNCGRRRGGPRVDFREHLPADKAVAQNGASPVAQATPPPAAAATSPVEQKPGRDYAPLAAVGGIAILGLMLLVGVLIGKGDGGSSTPPPVQVVSPTEGNGKTASDEGAEGEAGSSKKAKAKASGKTAKNAGSLTGSKGGGAPVEASDDALQELQEQSPEEYQESSAKLPDEIATGGAPPPEDSKAPGGGSKGTAIE